MLSKYHIKTESTGAKPLWRRLLPFLRWSGFIGWDTLKADMLAGLTGAVIVLPQGVAFAMIAGLPPEYGLYTAIITPIVAGLFGSSLHLISGPTTAISIVIFSTISSMADPGTELYLQKVLTLTFLAGIYQLAFGLARLGTLVNFVSHSVVVGFTSGAAILIATSQLKHVLGLSLSNGHSFIKVWVHIFTMFDQINLYVFAVAMVTLISAVIFRIKIPRWPGMLFAMIIGSLLCFFIDGSEHGVTLVGQMPDRLPPLSMPDFSFETIRELVPDAFAVALLGLIEALSIGRSIATKSHQQIDGNQEFIGQGLSNIVGSFFSSYAGSGSFTRSGINFQSGAITPMSAVFSASFLALILLLIAPLTAYLPIAAMGGIIMMVAYYLIEVKHIRTIIRTSKEETAVLLVTFLATLFLDLEFAIYIGVLLSLVLYLNRTAHPRIVNLSPNTNAVGPALVESETECDFLKIIRIDGPLFFGAVNHVNEYLFNLDKQQMRKRHVLIVGCGINFIDVAGAELLVQEARRRRAQRGDLYLCELQPQAYKVLEQGKHIAGIGKEHILTTYEEAIAKILPTASEMACRYCKNHVFAGCAHPLQTEIKGVK